MAQKQYLTWGEKDEEIFSHCLKSYSKQFEKYLQHFPQRTLAQVKSHYYNGLYKQQKDTDPNDKSGSEKIPDLRKRNSSKDVTSRFQDKINPEKIPRNPSVPTFQVINISMEDNIVIDKKHTIFNQSYEDPKSNNVETRLYLPQTNNNITSEQSDFTMDMFINMDF